MDKLNLKKVFIFLMAFLVLTGTIPHNLESAYAMAETELSFSDAIFTDGVGRLIDEVPATEQNITVTKYVTSENNDAQSVVIYLAAYKGGELLNSGASVFGVEKGTKPISATVAVSPDADKVRASVWKYPSLKPLTKTESFKEYIPGELLNVKMAGLAKDNVYGIPSLGAPVVDLYSKFFETDGSFKEEYSSYTAEDLIADLSDPKINPLVENQGAYGNYNDRFYRNNWELANGFYGDGIRHAYSSLTASPLFDKHVTRLYKPSVDPQTFPEKAYEFNVSKGATVYITVPSQSTYIEGLNKGWSYESNSNKYSPKFIGYKDVIVKDKNNADVKFRMPNGKAGASPYGSHTKAYYKHFNEGEKVEIPVFDTTQSYYETSVYVVWDDCNTEAKVFDILADGVSLNGFSENTYAYTLTVEEGMPVPVITVSATLGANARIIQAESFSDTAKIITSGGTYEISFTQVSPDTRLLDLSVNGETISGFDGDTSEYTYTIERGDTTLPKVSAITTISTHSLEITPITKVPCKTTVKVTSPSGASRTYTINFIKAGTPGELLNVKMAGAASAKVYGIPSLGAPSVDLYSKYFETDGSFKAEYSSYTAEDLIADLSDPKINPLLENQSSYGNYNDRFNTNKWGLANGYYGDGVRHAYSSLTDSPLFEESVTRLYKPSSDPQTYPERAYEFDVSKGATVYITVPTQSTYIESLNKGWTYDTSNKAKYAPKFVGYKGVTVKDKSGQDVKFQMPNGATSDGPYAMHTKAYYKHFEAGEHVEIPVHNTSNSYYQTAVYVVWDDCNDERMFYGVSYENAGAKTEIDFDAEILKYNITVPEGTTKVPTLIPSYTRPVGAKVSAPEEFTNGKAVVTMSAEIEKGFASEYVFNFYVDSSAENDIRLKGISLDGEAFDEFDMYVRDYAMDLPLGVEYPVVTATPNADTAEVTITQPKENNGIAEIKVTSENKAYNATYKIKFTKLDYVPLDAEIMKIKDGKDAIVTIVHDDGMFATVEYMQGEMEKNNLKATVAMITNNISDINGNLKTATVEKWKPFFNSGRFNLANHSFSHQYWGQSDSIAEDESVSSNGSTVPATYEGKMTHEIKTSGELLRKAFPNQRVLAFVKPGFTFPAGKKQVSDEAYRMLEENYILMRDTGGGMNTIPPSKSRKWYEVQSLMVSADDANLESSSNHTATYWTEEVDKTIEKNGWLVFLFHGIVDDANATSLNVSKSKASMFFDALGDRVEDGKIWCAFLDEAGMYIKEAETASVMAKDYSAQGKITVEITDKMDDEIYNYPVTAKVEMPSDWTYINLVQGDRFELIETFEENGKTYAYVNVVPDSGAAELTEASDFVTSIKYGETEIEGFDPVDTFYNVTLPKGTEQAPVVTATAGSGEASVEQATLTNGEGHAKVTYTVDGKSIVYEIHFSVDKTGTGPVVFLKLDDLREGEAVRTAFKNGIDYMNEKGLKANVGVITVSLEDKAGVDKTAYYNEIKGFAASGHEIWNHGYYHNDNDAQAAGFSGEFRTGTYDEQMTQLIGSTELLKSKCGLEVTSFGAPGNGTNTATVQVFKDFNASGDYKPFKTVYYGPSGVDGLLCLTTSLDFEIDNPATSAWDPMLNYKNFVASYQAKKGNDYIIMQTHPFYWGANAKSNAYRIFKDQINYLLMNGARFMTTGEYYDYVNAQN